MNSQGESKPVFTIAPTASMMWVWGEMGYAQTTSGRHSATVSATAREPSIWRSMKRLLFLLNDVPERRRGRGGVALANDAFESIAKRPVEGLERDLVGQRRESTQQRGVGQWSAEVFHRELGRGAGEQALRVK